MPASAIALPAASTDMTATVSSGPAQCLVAMPERERIHSSRGVDVLEDLLVGHHADRSVAADAEDPGVRARPCSV